MLENIYSCFTGIQTNIEIAIWLKVTNRHRDAKIECALTGGRKTKIDRREEVPMFPIRVVVRRAGR